MKNKGAFIGIVILAVVGIAAILTYFSLDNEYITLVNKYEAQVAEDKVVYDEVWKVIKQQAQISDKYSEEFRKVYTELMEARNYGGESMKWIQEQNPAFSQDMFMKLMSTIEIQRAKFTTVQKKLITYRQEIANLVQKWPGRWFIGGRPVPELKIVTSTKTEESFSTGKDDDVDLYEKK